MTLQSTNTQSLAVNVTNSLLFTHLEKETGWCHEKYIWKFMFAYFSGLFYFVVCSSRSPVDTVGHYGVGWGCGGIGDCSIGRRALFSTLLLSSPPLPEAQNHVEQEMSCRSSNVCSHLSKQAASHWGKYSLGEVPATFSIHKYKYKYVASHCGRTMKYKDDHCKYQNHCKYPNDNGWNLLWSTYYEN